MLIWTLGFSSISLVLGINFFRKYTARLNTHSHPRTYSRIADYHGRPIPLRFDYRLEDGRLWESVDTEVDEIFHYGKDYFLRGNAPTSKSGRIFNRSRIANLKIDAKGPELKSFEHLLVENFGERLRNAA